MTKARTQAEADEINFYKKLKAAEEGTSGPTDPGQEGAPGSTEQRQERAPGSKEQRQERAPGSATVELIGGKYLDGIMRKKHTKKRQIRRKRMRPSRK